MARKIVWTDLADREFTKTLQYYVDRNGSTTYSKSLNDEIENATNLLTKFPDLGLKTDLKDIRVLIKRNYKIFYRTTISEIIILLIWDTNQQPEKLDKLLHF